MHQSTTSKTESIMALLCYVAVIIAAITIICLGIMMVIFGGMTI